MGITGLSPPLPSTVGGLSHATSSTTVVDNEGRTHHLSHRGELEPFEMMEFDIAASDESYLQVLSARVGSDSEILLLYSLVLGALLVLKESISIKALASLCSADGLTEESASQICNSLRSFIHYTQLEDSEPLIRLSSPSISLYLVERAPHPYRLDPKLHHANISRLQLLSLQRNINTTSYPVLGYTKGNWKVFDIPEIPVIPKGDIPQDLCYSSRFLVDHLLELDYESLEEPHKALIHDVIWAKPREILEFTVAVGGVMDLGKLRAWGGPSMMNPTRGSLQCFPIIAQAMYCIAACLLDAKRPKEALTIVTECVSIYREMADFDPDPTIREGLAFSIRLQSKCFSKARRKDERLKASEEAVDIARSLVEEDPVRFESTLGTMLRNLCYRIEEDHAKAIEIANDSVEIFRRLIKVNFVEYEVHLATSLYALAYRLEMSGKFEEALPSSEESLVLYRTWVARNPTNWRRKMLADTLDTVSYLDASLSRRDDAISSCLEALTIWRELDSSNPGDCKTQIGCTLHMLADQYSKTKNNNAAIYTIKEAVEVRRAIALPNNEDETEIDLIDSLMNLASYSSSSGKPADAVEACTEAVKMLRHLIASFPESREHEAYLVRGVDNLSYFHRANGRLDLAVAAKQEAVSILRKQFDKLANDDPDIQTRSLFADTLYNHAFYLGEMGKHEAAVIPAREAVTVRRALVESNPLNHKLEEQFADALYRLGVWLNTCGFYGEALPCTLEAAGRYRALVSKGHSTLRLLLSLSIRAHVWCLFGMGQFDKTAGPANEAREILDQLWLTYPAERDYYTEILNGVRLLESISSWRRTKKSQNPQHGCQNLD